MESRIMEHIIGEIPIGRVRRTDADDHKYVERTAISIQLIISMVLLDT